MTFWTDSTFEPLRKYRFLVRIGDSDIRFDLKTVTLPNWETDMVEYKLMNHMIKYPGIGKWADCQMTFVVTSGSSQKKFLYMTGYKNIKGNGATLEKKKFPSNPRIELLSENGAVVTTFELWNAWIQSIEYGELNYEEDGFVEVNLTISVDYVKIK